MQSPIIDAEARPPYNYHDVNRPSQTVLNRRPNKPTPAPIIDADEVQAEYEEYIRTGIINALPGGIIKV